MSTFLHPDLSGIRVSIKRIGVVRVRLPLQHVGYADPIRVKLRFLTHGFIELHPHLVVAVWIRVAGRTTRAALPAVGAWAEHRPVNVDDGGILTDRRWSCP